MTKTALAQSISKPEKSLPKGWRWARLADVGQFESGGTPAKGNPQFWDGNIPFVTGADITELYVTRKNARAFVTKQGLYSGKTAICHPGTVLFVTRTRVGRVGIASEIMAASQDLSPFICGPDILPEFACRYLLSKAELLIKNCRGATIKGLIREFVHDILIPLPPIPDQKRIVKILTEQMEAVEKARTATEAQLEAAKTLSTSYLRAIFGKPHCSSWATKPIGELCEVRGGKRLPHGTDFATGKTRFPYLRVLDFHEGSVHMDGLKYLDESVQHQIARYIISSQDVYISIAGTIGVVGVVPDNLNGANLTENAAKIVIRNKETLNRDFLAWFLQSSLGQYAIRQRTNTVGQPKLALERIATVEIPIPSISEQKRIAVMLAKQISSAEKVIKNLQEQLETINKMPTAILGQAFTGKL